MEFSNSIKSSASKQTTRTRTRMFESEQSWPKGSLFAEYYKDRFVCVCVDFWLLSGQMAHKGHFPLQGTSGYRVIALGRVHAEQMNTHWYIEWHITESLYGFLQWPVSSSTPDGCRRENQKAWCAKRYDSRHRLRLNKQVH